MNFPLLRVSYCVVQELLYRHLYKTKLQRLLSRGASRTGQDNNCPGPEYGFLRSTTGVSCYYSLCRMPGHREYTITKAHSVYRAPKWSMGEFSSWLLRTSAIRRLCLVVIDEYSRFPAIDFTTLTTAKATIPKLETDFFVVCYFCETQEWQWTSI